MHLFDHPARIRSLKLGGARSGPRRDGVHAASDAARGEGWEDAAGRSEKLGGISARSRKLLGKFQLWRRSLRPTSAQ